MLSISWHLSGYPIYRSCITRVTRKGSIRSMPDSLGFLNLACMIELTVQDLVLMLES